MARGRLVLAFALIVATVGTLRGAPVRSWSLASAQEFASGTLDGTAIDVDGRVALAPGQTTLWGPNEGIVWGVEPDGAGGAFVALSSPTRVIHVTAAGVPEFWHTTGDETLAAAILPDQDGGVYVGFSPDGRLMHAAGPDAMQPVADSEALFIWALAATEDGSVWIGTGLPGRLVRLDSEGELHAVFESGDDPVRCIAPLGSDGVVFGTGGRGRVIRVDGNGRPFALFDAEETEIVALETSEDGVIYALTARGSKQVAAARAAAAKADASVRVTATAPPAPDRDEQPPEEDNGGNADQRRTSGKRFTTPPGGALYRIDPDGDSRRLWQANQDVPFALTRTEDGTLLVATGDWGRVYAVDDAGRAAVLLQIGSDQASALGLARDGSVLVGGTTDARVERIAAEPARVGQYVSPVHDAGAVSDWGRLRWEGDVSGGASIRAEVRAGNTAEPDETWTEWVSLKGGGSEGVETDLPPTRWLQVRMRFVPSTQGASPGLRRLDLFYRPRNRRPTITDLAVQPAGVVWRPATTQSTRPAGPLVAADPVTRRTVAELRPVAATKPVRRTFELGARTITWKATDPDGDKLTYRLDIRRDDSDAWIPLAVDLDGDFFGWDARGISDGLYRVRLTVMDASDNVDGESLEDSRDSAAFWVDNTRPSVGDPHIRRGGGGLEVEFVARDPGGNVVAAEVAVDAGDWQPLDPMDGVADEAEERYQLLIEPLDRGQADAQRTLKVRVTDAAGNMGGEAWALGHDR
jgi:sugar lactone lactonase YvrE